MATPFTNLVSATLGTVAQAQQTYGTASAFTISELTGQQRFILLAGRALPYRPVEFEGDQRAEFTWYPGSPIATVQVFGPSESPSTFRGMWKDRFIQSVAADLVGADTGVNLDFGTSPPAPGGPDAIANVDGVQVPDVATLAQTIDDIRRQGQLVEVHWDEIVRQGILTKFRQVWHRHEDLEYEMTFTWISQGEPEPPVVLAEEPDRGGFLAQLQTALQTLDNVISAPFELAGDFYQAVSNAQAQIEDATNSIQNAQVNYTIAATSAVSAAQTTIAAIQSIFDACSQIITAVEGRPAQAIPAVPASSATGEPDYSGVGYGQASLAAEYGRQLLLATRSIRSTCAVQGAALASRVTDNQVIAVFTARQGQDLRDVSTQYYGTQDEWKRIAQYNGLAQSQLDPGMVIFVPQFRPTDQSGGAP